MRTDELIQKLSGDLQPIRKPPTATLLTAIALLIAVVGDLAILAFFHWRTDLREVIESGPFVPSTIIFLAAFVTLAWATLALSRPGRRSVIGLALGAVFYIALFALLAAAPFDSGFGAHAGGWECTAAIALLATVPGAALFLLSRRLAPTRPAAIGLMAGIASASFGATALALSCPNDHPAHLLAWHLALPVFILGGTGWIAGRRILRW